jgi:hypothetical protein
LSCTLLGCWDDGHTDRWLVITDLPPEAANVCWYGMRAWIENGFKRLKSAGWQWQYTRMEDPKRAERLWLALAVAALPSGGGGAGEALVGRHGSRLALEKWTRPLPERFARPAGRSSGFRRVESRRNCGMIILPSHAASSASCREPGPLRFSICRSIPSPARFARERWESGSNFSAGWFGARIANRP